MSYYEYRVVPAPKSVPKVKGVKSPAGRFAVSMGEALNAEGREGWEFQSTETMETVVKSGLFSKAKAETLHVLVFRRWVETEEVFQAPAEPESRVAELTPRTPEPASEPRVPELSPNTPAPATADASRPTLSARRDEPASGTAPSLVPPRRD